jgi:hypothetical protein
MLAGRIAVMPGRLARAVRAEEAGHDAGPDAERQLVDGELVAVALGDVVDLDHGRGSRGRARCRAGRPVMVGPAA